MGDVKQAGTSSLALWWHALRALWSDISSKNMSLIAAGVAFFGMLSVFPALAAMIALWGLFSDPAELQAQMEVMEGFVPDQAYALLYAQLTALIAAQPATLGWAGALSIGFALWSSRAGVSALMKGLNAVYETSPRQGLRHYTDALVLTLALMTVGLVALACVVVAPVILAAFPLGFSTVLIIDILRWAVVVFVVIMALGVLYRYGPNRTEGRTNWFTPGAVATLCLWLASSAAFSIYLSHFGNYNEVYGSIGAVAALLMWFYISAFLILLGGGLNARLEEKAARIAKQPTTDASQVASET